MPNPNSVIGICSTGFVTYNTDIPDLTHNTDIPNTRSHLSRDYEAEDMD